MVPLEECGVFMNRETKHTITNTNQLLLPCSLYTCSNTTMQPQKGTKNTNSVFALQVKSCYNDEQIL